MDTVQANRLRKGMLVQMDGNLLRVMDINHLTPGKGHGYVQTRFRNIRSGSLLDHKFRSDDTVERAILDSRRMQYLYVDGETHYFMDTETFEQVPLSAETLGDTVSYLLPESEITIELFEDEPVGLQLPLTVELAVRETAPAIKGATASAQLKPAELETGLVVQVPPFIANGDKIRVNTETGEYQGRV